MTSPLTLSRVTAVHLASDLSISALAVGADYWEHRAEQAELADGRVLSILDYDTTWNRWERHPDGDELLLVLSGFARFHLDDEAGTRSIDLAAGDCGIVPRGAWHRAEIDEPTRILFITPTPARTEERPAAR